MPGGHDGGLGQHLVGDKISITNRTVLVMKMLGEGGFSYVYLVRDVEGVDKAAASVHGDVTAASSTLSSLGKIKATGDDLMSSTSERGRRTAQGANQNSSLMCLKVTSIHSRQQRDIAEKEAKLLSRLSHPSIIKMFDTCYRNVAHINQSSGGNKFLSKSSTDTSKERPQHLILMEYAEGGHALDVCSQLVNMGKRFDLSTLIIAFGQICNAVSYLHAQRPPIVHRDLKPVNFLVKNGAYKLCDFGSAVFGHVDLRTPRARAEAEEVIQKTTTQMFRAPEMVDLYMAKKLTQATDVWALGCCLYSLAFLQNCFEEGSNLAILSRKYKIPDDNPYGDGIVELLDRMLTVDHKARADMTEVILCLSALYSGRPLPPRKKSSKHSKEKVVEKKPERVGTFRTDGQGIHGSEIDPKKPVEAKKLNPNSAAARRRRAAQNPVNASASSMNSGSASNTDLEFSSFNSRFDEVAKTEKDSPVNEDLAFSTTDNPFADVSKDDVLDGNKSNSDIFGAFGNASVDFSAFGGTEWGKSSNHAADESNDNDGFGGSFSSPSHLQEGETGTEVIASSTDKVEESPRAKSKRRSNMSRAVSERKPSGGDHRKTRHGSDRKNPSERKSSALTRAASAVISTGKSATSSEGKPRTRRKKKPSRSSGGEDGAEETTAPSGGKTQTDRSRPPLTTHQRGRAVDESDEPKRRSTSKGQSREDSSRGRGRSIRNLFSAVK